LKKLVTGYIPNNYSSHTHISLGPWCFLEKQHLLFDGALFEPDPYESLIALKHDADLSNNFIDYYLPNVSLYLNEQNKSNYSEDFWRVLITPWFSTIIQVTLERYKRVKNLIEKYSDITLKVELKEINKRWNFTNTNSFMIEGIFSVTFNEWLISLIIEHNFNSEFEISHKQLNTKIDSQDRRSVKQKIFNQIISIFPIMGVYGLGLIEAPFWELFLKLKNIEKKEIDHVNKVVEQGSNLTEIINIVNWDYLIKATIPQFFLNVPNNIKKPKPRYLLLGPNYLYYQEKNKLKTAIHKEVGSKIICTQHGCRYGTLEALPFISSIEYVYDFFISWGWNKHSNYIVNAIDLPSPYLKKPKTKKKYSHELFFVDHHSALINYRLASVPQPADQIKNVKETITFIMSLKEEIKHSLIYRPYFNDNCSLDNYKIIQSLSGNIRLQKGSINKKIYNSRLLIINNPGTVFHQRMAANLPTIAFWDRKMWGLSKQAESYFNTLSDVGIIYGNGKDASKKVNKIWDNIEKWWQLPHVQEARKEWCWHYARTSNHWRWDWMKAIWKM
jgi:hypothetical protein